MTFRSVSAILLLSLAAGCTARADATGFGGSSATTDTPAAAAPDPRFKIFASQDEAFTWAAGFEKSYAEQQGIAPRAAIPVTDARYDRANKVVADAWTGFRQLYPERMASLPAPYVVLLEDPTVNAYAVYDPAVKASPDAFFILTGALGSDTAPIDEGQLYGLVAHELTHLVLLHQYPGVSGSRSIYYAVHGHEELGFLQESDADVQAAIDAWTAQSKTVGDFPLPELNGIPLIGEPELSTLLVSTLARIAGGQTPPKACAAVKAASPELRDFVLRTFDQVNFTWPLSDDDKTALSSLTKKFATAAHDCLAGGPKLAEAFAAQYGIPESVVTMALESDPDFASQLATPNLVDAIVATTNAKFDRLRELAKQHDYANLRVRTFEEEADDNSMLVTHFLGKDSKGIASFLFHESLPDDATRARCQALLDAGTVPGYGFLADPHHGTCYRVYHVNLFNRLVFANH
jgi:hypothetical protein